MDNYTAVDISAASTNTCKQCNPILLRLHKYDYKYTYKIHLQIHHCKPVPIIDWITNSERNAIEQSNAVLGIAFKCSRGYEFKK
jgi:hypothetical protein